MIFFFLIYISSFNKKRKDSLCVFPRNIYNAIYKYIERQKIRFKFA